MSLRILFEGQAVKSEMVVLVLEKWDLHPQMEEKDAKIQAQAGEIAELRGRLERLERLLESPNSIQH